MNVSDPLVAALKANLAGGKPAVPEAGRLLWNLFADLCASRSTGPSGPNPLASTEIEAWARLNRWPLQPHHVAVIRAMDAAWIEAAYARLRPPDGKTLPSRSERPITAEMFDAMMG